MTLSQFKATLDSATPPAAVGPALTALWHDGRGDWDTAHRVAQEEDTAEGAWIHAYLHRKEGDASNAAHWYRRAGQPVAAGPFDAEWDAIAAALLQGEA